MNGKYYFISDIHLGVGEDDKEKQKERSLVRFIESIMDDAENLYIVGDLFDCWIEYRKVVPKGFFRLFTALNDLVEKGIQVHFLSGNHDFWINKYLRDEIGLKIHTNEMKEELDGKKFYIIHGDGLSKKDFGYFLLKKILRNRFNQFMYSLIHPDVGIYLAQKSSKKSRDYNATRETIMPDYMINFAADKIISGFDYVIMGHFHKPVMQSLCRNDHSGCFITLGDWIKYNSYGVFGNNEFSINYWEKKNK